MDKRNTSIKTIILFKNNNLATMLYAAKLKTDENVLRLSNFSCVYSLVRLHIMKMRLFYMIIPILMSCSTTVKIEKSNIENISKTKYKRTCGIILEKDYVSLFPNEFNGMRFTPNEEDILKAEIILENKIKETNTLNLMNQGNDCPIIHKNLKKYFRQYSGELNSKNEKIININMLWNKFPFWNKLLGYVDQREKYKKGYFFVIDGCSYYWRISINISTEKIELFTVNGVA